MVCHNVFHCTDDLVGQLNGNRQKGMLQIDAPPVEIFCLRHWAKSMGLRAQGPRVPPKRIKGYKSFTYATRTDEKLNRLSMTSSFGNNCTKVTEIGHPILTLSLNLGSYTFFATLCTFDLSLRANSIIFLL